MQKSLNLDDVLMYEGSLADSTNATVYKWMNYGSNDCDRRVEQDYDHCKTTKLLATKTISRN